MKIKVLDNNDIMVKNGKGNKYIIRKEHIYGTLIYNYFVYEICDNIEYDITSYATLEDALKDLEKGYCEV